MKFLKCKWCDYKATGKSISGSRYKHLLSWHPERRAEWSDKRVTPWSDKRVTPFQWAEVKAGSKYFWTCKHGGRERVPDHIPRVKLRRREEQHPRLQEQCGAVP